METPSIPDEEYRRIEREIASEDSPVGIDAKKTHVLILHRLDEIARRLERIEGRMDKLEPAAGE